MMNRIYIESLKEQDDGRFTITYKLGNETYLQPNAAFCCYGTQHRSDGDYYYSLEFEVVGLNHNLPKKVENEHAETEYKTIFHHPV
jgi:hypothetical protein